MWLESFFSIISDSISFVDAFNLKLNILIKINGIQIKCHLDCAFDNIKRPE